MREPRRARKKRDLACFARDVVGRLARTGGVVPPPSRMLIADMLNRVGLAFDLRMDDELTVGAAELSDS